MGWSPPGVQRCMRSGWIMEDRSVALLEDRSPQFVKDGFVMPMISFLPLDLGT